MSSKFRYAAASGAPSKLEISLVVLRPGLIEPERFGELHLVTSRRSSSSVFIVWA
jgi:hypothetical protein